MGYQPQVFTILRPVRLLPGGVTDADVLKDYIKGVYKAWDFTLYAFIDIKRVTGTAPELGSSMRIDIWVADAASLAHQIGLTVTGDYLYVVSLEIPEAYLTALSLFASTL